MRILIETIPHAFQRYDTCGDYTEQADGTWHFRISKCIDWRHEFLIAIHELVEKALNCRQNISDKQVDAFDFDHAAQPNSSEPGNDPDCPYYSNHQIASGFERMMAAELGVNWEEYEAFVENL